MLIETIFAMSLKAGSSSVVRKMEHADSDDEWLVPNAYLYFHDVIDEWLGPTGTEAFHRRLDALYQALRDDLHLVVIDLEAQDDAQEIFETLNALGTLLLQADLVKNYLFHLGDSQKEDTRKLYKLYWEGFDDERGYWRKEVRQGRLKRPRLDLFLYHFLTLMLREEIPIPKLFSSYRELVEESEGIPRSCDTPGSCPLGVPIASGMFYPWTGLLLTPIMASAATALSSVSVIGNALRLRRVQL